MKRTMFAVGLLALQASALAQGPPASRVRFDAVREQTVERQREVTGQLRASRASMAASREQGRVIEMLVDVGDRVEVGQPLARLDAALLQLDLKRAEADLVALERSVDEFRSLSDQAALEVARRERAKTEGGISEMELEDARIGEAAANARAARAEADAASARASLAQLQQRISDTVIVAPFAGSVVAKLTEVGEWIDQGEAVVEVVQLDPIDAWLEVPERYIDDAGRASAITVEVESLGVTVEGSEVAIVARADELARTFPVRVRVPNPKGELKPGMSASASLPTGIDETVVTVHKDALLRDDAGTFVFFDAGGMAMPIRVERLWGVGDRVVVRAEALRPGMKVVIEGNERMYPSQPIVDMDAPPAPPAGAPSAEKREGE